MNSVLIIDDERHLLDEIVDHLQFAGYDAFGTTVSQDALLMARELEPDVIVCDVMMPGLDGYGVLLDVRSHPETATIPFIFLTGRTGYAEQRRGMRTGADDYIYKPFHFPDLIEAIEIQLRKSTLRRRRHTDEMAKLKEQLDDDSRRLTGQSQFIGMMVHDCKTPLSVMLSSTQLLQRYYDRLSVERRETHLSNLERQVYRLRDIMDDLLCMVRSESEAGLMVMEPVDLTELCELVSVDLQHEFPAHAIRQVGFDKPVICQGDASALQRMLINLLSNAAKYSPEGSEIVLQMTPHNDTVEIAVIDNGIGIPQEDQKRLFQAFQRGSNVADIPGTGLGLVVVDRVIQTHGGHISFDSEEGEGTTFRVVLPTLPDDFRAVN